MANIKVNFLSYTLHRAVDLTVIIPTVCFPEMFDGTRHPSKETRYPVLYLLHGYGNNHATWNGYTSVELFAEERNIAVVMLSAENMAYIDHGGDYDYFLFISEELPEFCKGMFPISERREDTFIAGLSMGGYGSFVHGLSRSGNFAAIGSFSGALKMRDNEPTSPDPYKLAKECAEEDRRIPVYIACGDQDHLLDGNRKFVEYLKKLGFSITYDEVPGYGHEWRFWNLEAERFMDWIPRSDPYYLRGEKRKI